MTTSAINSALSTSTALMNKLASVNAATATAKNANTLALIQNTISNQFNQKVTALQDQVQTSSTSVLQQQQTNLNTQLTTYQNAETAISQNNLVLADLTQQLSTLATAAQSGDSTTFDQTLSAAQTDINDLQAVPFAAGLQPDGTSQLTSTGLGIQSSSTYDLSTSAGQAQALSDVQAAEAQVEQVVSLSTLNQQIAASAQTPLQTQISAISTQINNTQTAQQAAVAAQTATLEQQAQEEYHIIELNLGNDSNASSFLSSVENYSSIADTQPGTTLSLLGGTSGEPLLPVANLTTSSSSTSSTSSSSSSSSSSNSSSGSSSSSSSGSSSLGSLFSTTA